jgi:hypothetical protein
MSEDERAEALWDTIADILTEGGVDCSTETAEKMIERIAKLCGNSYGDGYQTGVAEAEMGYEMARSLEKSDE